jgi:hypothetical protein
MHACGNAKHHCNSSSATADSARDAKGSLGIRHGAYCVGCCWALMAPLFVGGVTNLLSIPAQYANAHWERLNQLLTERSPIRCYGKSLSDYRIFLYSALSPTTAIRRRSFKNYPYAEPS